MALDVDQLSELLGDDVVALSPLTGGDVAQSFRVQLQSGRTVFAKTHPTPPPGFFTTEAAGLEWLRSAGVVLVPEVLAVSDEPPLLALEWIDESPLGSVDDAAFGVSLARLHASGAACFGREDRRTTGSRGLPNEPCDAWSLFYATQRLLPLAKLAQDGDALDPVAIAALGSVATRLPELGGPEERPHRLHGDLWAGNRLVDSAGRSWLIDPASHGGHREFDLAMMRLFGGFGPTAFAAYDETCPLADGWEQRVALHQLAPLVVHAIKFGGGYRQAVTDALSHYR